MARLERTREGILEGVSKLYLLLLNSIYNVVCGCISVHNENSVFVISIFHTM